MRPLLILLFALLACTSRAASPQLLLDVARFHNEDMAVKGAIVEIYATVPGQSLTYMRRAPKAFQAAAVVTLEVLKADGKPAYQETITLKPPVLSDTSIALKNPVSFQKRIALPDGQYTLRGKVRDQYRAGQETTVEVPLILEAGAKKASLSDIVLLSRPAAKSPAQNSFARGGYNLVRTPGGLYARGTSQIFFYTELYQAPQGQPLSVRYKLVSEEGAAAEAEVQLDQAAAGRPTPVVGELPLGPLPSGKYTFTMEVRDSKKQLIATQTTHLQRDMEEYAPSGASSN
ncbi:Ig-like domain-containing protein [Hymenobacter jejuensis]|uniref:Macroglobulin domain-containing protein n=1 Tax=Hymenobacter jejuensis TaxID=2502781 RepID=A0A5B7ZXC2_9BACT|nr:hypothetical protein [Hymenobacter jejuensis]QDA59265.1 hypothetical protein FHG12_03710 [Hymenobacter jejuensis]